MINLSNKQPLSRRAFWCTTKWNCIYIIFTAYWWIQILPYNGTFLESRVISKFYMFITNFTPLKRTLHNLPHTISKDRYIIMQVRIYAVVHKISMTRLTVLFYITVKPWNYRSYIFPLNIACMYPILFSKSKGTRTRIIFQFDDLLPSQLLVFYES